MRHFFTRRVRIILVAAVLLAAALAVSSSLLGYSIPDLVVKSILTPIHDTATALTRQAEQMYSYMFRYEAVVAENNALREQIAQMEDDARRADALSRENDRLRSLLGISEANDDYEYVDAYIIGRSSVDWTSSVTVNRGSTAGIEIGMCAMTSNGEVVGLVTEVGTNYAVIKTVLDSSLEISATISSTGYNGMVAGGYTSGQAGMLRMDYLPSSAVIRNNDQVVTSGSTVYPRGLILGHVVDAGYEETGVAKYALLEPAVDVGKLEQVFILTAYTTE